MLIKGYEDVVKVTAQQRLIEQYAKLNKTENTTKPVEGIKKCQTKKTITRKKK
jgi:hypothetical protein